MSFLIKTLCNEVDDCGTRHGETWWGPAKKECRIGHTRVQEQKVDAVEIWVQIPCKVTKMCGWRSSTLNRREVGDRFK